MLTKEMKQMNGRIIAKARKAKGLTQSGVAYPMFVNPQAISNFERGMNCPDEENAKKLEYLLGLKEGTLYTKDRVDKAEKERESMKTVKPLAEINSLKEMREAVVSIVEGVPFDQAFGATAKTIVTNILYTTIGNLQAYSIFVSGSSTPLRCPWRSVAEQLYQNILWITKDSSPDLPPEKDWDYIVGHNKKDAMFQKILLMSQQTRNMMPHDEDGCARPLNEEDKKALIQKLTETQEKADPKEVERIWTQSKYIVELMDFCAETAEATVEFGFLPEEGSSMMASIRVALHNLCQRLIALDDSTAETA